MKRVRGGGGVEVIEHKKKKIEVQRRTKLPGSTICSFKRVQLAVKILKL